MIVFQVSLNFDQVNVTLKNDFTFIFQPYSGWAFLGLRTDEGAKKPPLPKSCYKISYNDETWHTYALTKEGPKNA